MGIQLAGMTIFALLAIGVELKERRARRENAKKVKFWNEIINEGK